MKIFKIYYFLDKQKRMFYFKLTNTKKMMNFTISGTQFLTRMVSWFTSRGWRFGSFVWELYRKDALFPQLQLYISARLQGNLPTEPLEPEDESQEIFWLFHRVSKHSVQLKKWEKYIHLDHFICLFWFQVFKLIGSSKIRKGCNTLIDSLHLSQCNDLETMWM